ncbi:MAG: hypothetical protein WD737_13985 [Gemmatimonadota bacterium]
MSREERRDQVSDPVLEAALAELRSDVPDDVDWGALRQSINERAQLALARRRVRRSHPTFRAVARLAVAASIAFALWMGPGLVNQVLDPASSTALTEVATQDEMLAEALASDLTEQEFRLLVTGRANPEELLAFALGQP